MAKRTADDTPDLHGGRLRIPRSRGAVSGFLLTLLGAWGALIPLVGPYVHFGYTPDTAWHLSSGRIWLEVLPGAATVVGGLLLLTAANRITASVGGWLAVAGGAWFVVGPTLRSLLHIGSVGSPIHTSNGGKTLETLLLFSGIGAAILFLAGAALGRLAVVGIRDVLAAQRRERDDTGTETPHAPRDETGDDDRRHGVLRRPRSQHPPTETRERPADVDAEDRPQGATRVDLAQDRTDTTDDGQSPSHT